MQIICSICSPKADFKVFASASNVNEAPNYIPAAPILLPDGDGVWKQVSDFIIRLLILFYFDFLSNFANLLSFCFRSQLHRFREELRLLRDLKLRAYMVDYGPKEKNLILRLSPVTLIPMLQVLSLLCLFYT